jgi:hypothetical protein
MNIYIGYDSSNYGQEIAYRVCKRSIKNYNSHAQIEPLKLVDLRYNLLYTRPPDEKQSTEFTYSRFLSPYLNGYEGYALFCDSDFLWRCDPNEVLKYIDDTKAISCIKHEYTECPSSTKMDGLKQEWYPRKNWSSLMLFNCNHKNTRNLDVKSVNEQTPKYLHRMEWAEDENIGSIPVEYNYLVGYYNFSKEPKALHFTDGGPWHKNHVDVEFAEEWLSYLTQKEQKEHKEGLFWEQ